MTSRMSVTWPAAFQRKAPTWEFVRPPRGNPRGGERAHLLRPGRPNRSNARRDPGSRSFSMNRGSVDSFQVRTTCGLRPNAHQIRDTTDCCPRPLTWPSTVWTDACPR
jgi:hypothetical protein